MRTTTICVFLWNFWFCDVRAAFVVSRAFLESEWSEHINPATEKEKISMASAPGNHPSAAGPFFAVAGKKAESAFPHSVWAIMSFVGPLDLLVRRLFILLVSAYRIFISPLLGNRCRFNPTCSQYAMGALRSKTFVKSIALIFVRVTKCHPFHDGGYDPVK